MDSHQILQSYLNDGRTSKSLTEVSCKYGV